MTTEDLKNCAKVSEKCNEIIFDLKSGSFKNEVELLRNNERFHLLFPKWIEVYDYILNLGDYCKLEVFKYGMNEITTNPNEYTNAIRHAIEENNIEFYKNFIEQRSI